MAAIRVYQLTHRKTPTSRVFNERLSLSDLREEDVVSRYRLNKGLIVYLLSLIEPDISLSNRGRSIPPITQLLITLRVLAKGDFYSEAGDLHGVSRSSVSRIVHKVICAINRRLDNIRFPQGEALNHVKLAFYRSCKIPNVIGAIDGTLIPIAAPVDAEEAYVCRKGYHALNVQAVVEPSLRFLDVVARWPGATHDASIFENCGLKDHLEQASVGHLLGDSGYPLRDYVLTPVLGAQQPADDAYNVSHKKGRVCVKRAFGVLKARFRCLHKSAGCLQYRPVKCAQLIMCCARLHNLCVDNGLANPEPIYDDDGTPALSIHMPDAHGQGQTKRQSIINLFQ